MSRPYYFSRYDPLLEALVWIQIRGAGGGDGPPPPSPAQEAATKSQTAIMNQQLELAKRQEAYANAVTPLELAQAGYEMSDAPMITTPAVGEQYLTSPTVPGHWGPAGRGGQQWIPDQPGVRHLNKDYVPEKSVVDQSKVQTGQYVVPIGEKQYLVSQRPDLKALQQLNTQVATAAGERSLKAAKGELAIDPGVEQDLTRGEQTLREELLKRLGPGYETSDPGIRALTEYQRQSNSIRFQVRYGELSNAGAMSTNAQANLSRQQMQALGTLQGVQQPFAVTANMLGQAGGTAGNIVGQQQQERFGAFNLGLQSSQIGAGMIGSGVSGLLGAGGMIGGAMIIA